MKSLKKPTYSQRKRIEDAGLDSKKVLVERDLGHSMIVVDRETNQKTEITCEK